jgi:predicted nucleic-acid-binding Zn-ribbon protein
MNIQTCPKCGKKSYKDTDKREASNVIIASHVVTNFAVVPGNQNG